ncbi:MAG: hypothetical protein RBS39_02010 [Phycisphaerales bacterium]|jgi:hypothetical protein|nr:hypothetical protein [Phycisphaerales bacterium]
MHRNDHLDHHERGHVLSHRELFWQNVMREALTSLSVQAMMIRAQHEQAARIAQAAGSTQTLTGPGLPEQAQPLMRNPDDEEGEDAGGADIGEDEESNGHLLVPVSEDEETEDADDSAEIPGAGPLDGRIGIITTQGMRIPIADIYPLFACSVPGSPEARAISEEVQCTVFQVRTPGGEVYTLPLSEIRGLHGANPLAMAEFEAARSGGGSGDSTPFGYAAFTSLAREEASRRGEVKG